MDKELRNVLKSATLLLVDNNEITLIKFRRILESFVKKVYYASNGKEALKIYKKNKPSFIITDIEMPHMNGLEFVEIIRKKNEYIPIMIVSAFINKEYCLSSIKLQVCDYLIKPINLDQVIISLKKIAKILKKDLLPLIIEINEGVFYKPVERIICVDNHISKLTTQESDLLDYLILNRGNIITKQMVEDKIYIFKEMGESALKNIIYKLRKKLVKNVIITVDRIGYKIE